MSMDHQQIGRQFQATETDGKKQLKTKRFCNIERSTTSMLTKGHKHGEKDALQEAKARYSGLDLGNGCN